MTVLDDTVAVRHLLRHLNDPRALRRNVLSSPFFETVTTAAEDNATGERLKTLVADCIESLARPKGGTSTRPTRQGSTTSSKITTWRESRETKLLLTWESL